MVGRTLMRHHYQKNLKNYSPLNMEDIGDLEYKHAKIVCKKIKTKKLVEYHDLYVQSDIFLLHFETCVLKI